MQEFLQSHPSKEDASKQLTDLLHQIQFFSHERLIHLIVTVSFALFTIMALAITLFVESYVGIFFVFGLLIIDFFYVRHYYILENGVQKLYLIYDELWKEI